MSTIFTRIIQGEIPSYKIYEDDQVYAFLDINPSQKGHTLVVTKEPYETLMSSDDKTAAHAFLVAKKIAVHMQQVFGCERVNIVVEGVEVPHLHIHIIPIIPPHKNATWNHVSYEEGEMEEYQKKLLMN